VVHGPSCQQRPLGRWQPGSVRESHVATQGEKGCVTSEYSQVIEASTLERVQFVTLSGRRSVEIILRARHSAKSVSASLRYIWIWAQGNHSMRLGAFLSVREARILSVAAQLSLSSDNNRPCCRLQQTRCIMG
jgi:hypothetical protein